MKLTLAEPKYLKESIATISELITEARFTVTKKGITMVAMDPANVAMVVFTLFSSSFVEYELEEDVDISLNISQLKNVLKRAGSNDLVTLQVADSKLVVGIQGSSQRRFSLPLLDADDREQRVPNLQFGMKITLPTDHLIAAVDDMSIVSDSLMLSCNGSSLVVDAAGDSTDARVELSANDKISISVEGDTEFKSRYSIEYLKKMMSGGKVSDTVLLQFAKDYPLRLEFSEKDRVQLAFVLAPRVENS